METGEEIGFAIGKPGVFSRGCPDETHPLHFAAGGMQEESVPDGKEQGLFTGEDG
jgi:hypothetical protein